MSESKTIQKIEIPSLKSSIKDDSFNLWTFLSTKSETKSNCPLKGSLNFAREKPIKSILLFFMFLLFVVVTRQLNLVNL